jgi:hypothetical protein
MNPVQSSSSNTNVSESQQVNSKYENSDDFRTIWARVTNTQDLCFDIRFEKNKRFRFTQIQPHLLFSDQRNFR